MSAAIFQWVGGALVVIGSLFMVVGAIGLIRMPDVFTRMHAASVSDSLGVGLILLGLIFFAGFTLVAVKLIFLILAIAVTGPTATHAVARAALVAGVRPVGADGAVIEDAEPEDEEVRP